MRERNGNLTGGKASHLQIACTQWTGGSATDAGAVQFLPSEMSDGRFELIATSTC